MVMPKGRKPPRTLHFYRRHSHEHQLQRHRQRPAEAGQNHLPRDRRRSSGGVFYIILEIEKHSVVENREKLNFANSASEKAKSACISQPQQLYLKQYSQPSEHEKTEEGHKIEEGG